MNDTAEKLIDALTLRVRAVTIPQGMKLMNIRDPANYRRLLRPLVEADLVRVVTVLAKPVPELREPLLASGGAVHPGAFAEVLRRARERWAALPAVPTRCVVATRRGGNLFGIHRNGRPAKNLQCTHDLAVAGALLAALAGGCPIERWSGEDCAHFPLGEKVPDAIIVDAGGRPERVIEIVGADYDQERLASIRQHCQTRGVGYELW